MILALLALCHPWSTPHTVLTIIPREHYMLTSAPTPYVFGVSDTEDIAPYIGADVAVRLAHMLAFALVHHVHGQLLRLLFEESAHADHTLASNLCALSGMGA